MLPPPQGKLLALDVGLARIGVAVCDGLQLTMRPLTVVTGAAATRILPCWRSWRARSRWQAVICGLPLNMDGSEGRQAQTTRKWAMRLAQALRVLLGQPLPVIFWDERLTTFAAQELMAEPSADQAASLGERHGKMSAKMPWPPPCCCKATWTPAPPASRSTTAASTCRHGSLLGRLLRPADV